jgi:hypothetical protein
MAGTTIAGIDLGITLPTFSTQGWGLWFTLIAFIILFLLIFGLVIWVYIQNKVYYIQIRDFENISGRGYQLAGRNSARIIAIGDGGEELLLLRKGKRYRTAYGLKMGRNEYWFAKGQDGYMYNVVLGDLDAKMGTLDIEPIDRDMRYMHVAIRKNIQDRYKKISALQQYAPIIISFVFVIIILIATWLLISKVGDLIHIASQNIEASKPLAEKTGELIGKLDSICSGGGGIRTAA